jgi:hypothetical protein
MQGIIISLIVSLVFSGLGYMSGNDPYLWFGVAFFGQFVLFFFYNMGIKAYSQAQTNKLTVLRLNAIGRNRTVLECATCKHPNPVDIQISETSNGFKCEKCMMTNSVYTTFKVFQKTEIVDGIITDDIAKKLILDKNTGSEIPKPSTEEEA